MMLIYDCYIDVIGHLRLRAFVIWKQKQDVVSLPTTGFILYFKESTLKCLVCYPQNLFLLPRYTGLKRK